ncbi:hypothetical protein H8356DRAFT_1344534 [Neocallimastix lanati (nom. inval.)]|nr:hypothetical protein H8356DRAFT_1344534 [Neocallimastix sp. JGI-2020a]
MKIKLKLFSKSSVGSITTTNSYTLKTTKSLEKPAEAHKKAKCAPNSSYNNNCGTIDFAVLITKHTEKLISILFSSQQQMTSSMPKKSGELRLYMHYKKLNQITNRNIYSIP